MLQTMSTGKNSLLTNYGVRKYYLSLKKEEIKNYGHCIT